MGAKKVTKGNHLPGKDDDRFVVYSKQFNEAIDYYLLCRMLNLLKHFGNLNQTK